MQFCNFAKFLLNRLVTNWSLSNWSSSHEQVIFSLKQPAFNGFFFYKSPSIRDRVLRSGMLLYLHHRDSKIFFHPAKFDNFRDEKISDFKTVSVSQRKNLLD